MNLLYLIQKELNAAWNEATSPVFQDNSADDYFHNELFDYYHSLKGKIIDTNSGESLFLPRTDNVRPVNGIAKAQHRNPSEVSISAGFQVRNWKPA
jgi:hypothetical protein